MLINFSYYTKINKMLMKNTSKLFFKWKVLPNTYSPNKCGFMKRKRIPQTRKIKEQIVTTSKNALHWTMRN